ncbi:LTA synthase family protein [Paenalcaligenes sp. Me52]|uniref:LTA synthase family protein n=1 Tax=Paenalcaligenes sp. Me52 TaxID=3392038 RepID=UPI003D2DD6BF
MRTVFHASPNHTFRTRWSCLFRTVWMLILLAVLGLALARFALLYFQGPANISLFQADVGRAFWIGLRFDLKFLAILMGPFILISLVFYRVSATLWKGFYAFFLIYAFVLLVALNLLSAVNFYYFTFYQGPINALIFGFAEDDTSAVVQTMWQDFPVISLLALILIGSSMQWWLAKRWGQYRLSHPLSHSSAAGLAVLVIGSVAVLVLLGRGSIGKFPLRSMHMTVSQDAFVNSMVPSGLHALDLARKERSSNDLGKDPDKALRLAGFATWQEAAQQCYADPTQAIDDTSLLFQQYPATYTTDTPAPHVVVALMESWGRHLMDYDDPKQNDVLGQLRPWVEGKADYFDHAISSDNGTHPSLEAVLLDTPISPLTQSRYGYQSYDTSRIKPYKDAGYRTIFLTAGPGSWRQLNTVLLRQGFDEVHDENDIRTRFPDASSHTWGLDDEWMFKYAAELLKDADEQGEKVMLFMLSVTNHPPYRIPAHYTPAALDTAALGSDMATDAATGLSILQTYQYANNALGEFLNTLEQQKLLDHTLFAASGDHNGRTLFAYPDNTKLAYKFGVPILFYIPTAYRDDDVPVDLHAWSSHQDIFPTLWAHSLPAQTLPRSSGRDLYTPSPTEATAVSLSSSDGGRGVSISREGAISNLWKPHYLSWNERGELQPTDTPSAQLVAQGKRQLACLALSDWRIRHQAISATQHKH